MKRIAFLLTFLVCQAQADDLFFRPAANTSTVLGPICVPKIAGTGFLDTLDFNTTGLSITVFASGDGVDSSETYTAAGATIDDYDGTPPAWGNPADGNIEIEEDGDCIRMHVPDDIMATSGATEVVWTITDGESAIMDWTVRVLFTESVDDTWDEACAGHTTAGTVGAQLCTDIDDILVDTSTTLDDKLDAVTFLSNCTFTISASAPYISVSSCTPP